MYQQMRPNKLDFSSSNMKWTKCGIMVRQEYSCQNEQNEKEENKRPKQRLENYESKEKQLWRMRCRKQTRSGNVSGTAWEGGGGRSDRKGEKRGQLWQPREEGEVQLLERLCALPPVWSNPGEGRHNNKLTDYLFPSLFPAFPTPPHEAALNPG